MRRPHTVLTAVITRHPLCFVREFSSLFLNKQRLIKLYLLQLLVLLKAQKSLVDGKCDLTLTMNVVFYVRNNLLQQPTSSLFHGEIRRHSINHLLYNCSTILAEFLQSGI